MDKTTIDTYNKLARAYDAETADFWDRFPRTFLDKFITLSGKKVVDVGSGPGRDGALMRERGKEVVCIDASKEMVALSTSRGLSSHVADFHKIPFDDSTFDAVWAYTSLLHVPKKQVIEVITEISRILKPQAFFACGLIEGDGEGYRESSGVNLPRWFSYYQKDEIEKIVESAGFTTEYFEVFAPGSKRYLNHIFRKH